MLMRYHWGLGIGHIYSRDHNDHLHLLNNPQPPSNLNDPEDTNEVESGIQSPNNGTSDPCMDEDSWQNNNVDVEDPELGLEERDREPEWDNSESDANEDELRYMSEISEEELELHSTYEID